MTAIKAQSLFSFLKPAFIAFIVFFLSRSPKLHPLNKINLGEKAFQLVVAFFSLLHKVALCIGPYSSIYEGLNWTLDNFEFPTPPRSVLFLNLFLFDIRLFIEKMSQKCYGKMVQGWTHKSWWGAQEGITENSRKNW